jgi:hypothetical protein
MDLILKKMPSRHSLIDSHSWASLGWFRELEIRATGIAWWINYPQCPSERGHLISREKRQSSKWRCRQIELRKQRFREKKSGLRWCNQRLQRSSKTPDEPQNWRIIPYLIEVLIDNLFCIARKLRWTSFKPEKTSKRLRKFLSNTPRKHHWLCSSP